MTQYRNQKQKQKPLSIESPTGPSLGP